MTYTLDTLYVGYESLKDGWADTLNTHGAFGDIATILAAYDNVFRTYNLNPNIALGQACLETAYFTSSRWKNEWNPAGLGITSGDTPPNPFQSIKEGVTAHGQHLCCYVYNADQCPVDHNNMVDRRHLFHDGKQLVRDLERWHVDANGVKVSERMWAVPNGWPNTDQDPLDYCRHIVDIANNVSGTVTSPQPQPGGNGMRIIVHAGHQNIGQITSDPNGAIDAAALRGGTGANGEMQWTVACAAELGRLLSLAGVDVVVTDAIYHAEVYGPDADLVIALHYDGSGSTGHAQYCMAATVHSGPSTDAADSLADGVIADWNVIYPAQTGINNNGPITVDMVQYYGGWYRSSNTPMILVEHCLGADANGIRADRPKPEVGAAADYAVLAKHFNLTHAAPPPPPDGYTHSNGFIIGGAFQRLYNSTPFNLQAFGLALSNEKQGQVTDPASDGLDEHAITRQRTVQHFERAVFVYQPENAPPWDVVAMPITSSVAEES